MRQSTEMLAKNWSRCPAPMSPSWEAETAAALCLPSGLAACGGKAGPRLWLSMVTRRGSTTTQTRCSQSLGIRGNLNPSSSYLYTTHTDTRVQAVKEHRQGSGWDKSGGTLLSPEGRGPGASPAFSLCCASDKETQAQLAGSPSSSCPEVSSSPS